MADVLDARGLKCPLPVLKLEKRLRSLPPGVELIVLATDPIAKIDIPLYCRRHGYALTLVEAEGVLRFAVVKATD